MSGHSKWTQIKHKKAVTDIKRGKLFSKLSREIMVAAKTGGSVGQTNVRLRAAIERAHSEGLAKENIERAIMRGSGGTDHTELKEFLFEATSFNGIAIIIEGITDNINRTVAEIKHILNKFGGRMADSGSIQWNFEKIGILETTVEKNLDKTPEEIELAIIESGSRDFFMHDNTWIIETNFTDREKVRSALEQQGITINTSGHDYKPKSTITLNPADYARIEPLLDALDEQDDVQEIYTNIQEQ